MNQTHESSIRESWRHWLAWPGMVGFLVAGFVGAGAAVGLGKLAPGPFGSIVYGSMACLYLGLPALLLGAMGWGAWLWKRKGLLRRLTMAAHLGLAGTLGFALVLPTACRHFMRQGIAQDRLAAEQAYRRLLAQLRAGTLKPDAGKDDPVTDPVLVLNQWEGHVRLPASKFQGRTRGSGAISSSIGFTFKEPLQGELAVVMRRGLIFDIYDGHGWPARESDPDQDQCEWQVTGWESWFNFPSE